MRILIFILTAAISLVSMVQAQDMKLGFVQVERLMQDFPEYEDAINTYEKEIESWQMQLNEYEQEIQGMMQDFEQRAMLYSPERKQEEQEKILEKRQEAVKYYQDVFGQSGESEGDENKASNTPLHRVACGIWVGGHGLDALSMGDMVG